MSRRVIIMAMILGMFFLAGCSNNEEQVTSAGTPYIGGTQGIVADFEDMGIYNEKTGINEIFWGESFPIEVTLKNKGEYDVQSGEVDIEILGINTADFSGISSGELSNDEGIEGVSEYNNIGEEMTIDFTPNNVGAVYNIDLAGASYDVNVFASVMYYYETTAAVPNVCFKEDLTDESICNVDEMKSVYSSGAPIQVQSVEEKRAGTGKVALEFKIANVGSGDVALPGEDFDSRYDQLEFEISEPEEWDCKSGGNVNMARLDSDGKATILCRLKTGMAADTLFTKEVDMTLSYRYKELISEQVRIKEQ